GTWTETGSRPWAVDDHDGGPYVVEPSGDVDDRPERLWRRHRIADAEDRPTSCRNRTPKRTEQRRLADPCLAFDHDEAASFGDGLPTERMERPERSIPLKEVHALECSARAAESPWGRRRCEGAWGDSTRVAEEVERFLLRSATGRTRGHGRETRTASNRTQRDKPER